MKLIDIAGQRFGRLTVIQKTDAPKMWRCICDCGRETLAAGSSLRRGHKSSCGCLATEWSASLGANPDFIKKRSDTKVVHGHKRKSGMTAEYRTWLGMKRRCQDTKYKDYPNWGGRGIRVCDRWDLSFENFLADMGLRPSNSHSIDRIDPNGNYEPNNCRWATLQEQGGEHRRGLQAVEMDGLQFESLKRACIHFGLPYTTVVERLKRGITLEASLKTPLRKLPNNRQKESYLKKSARQA